MRLPAVSVLFLMLAVPVLAEFPSGAGKSSDEFDRLKSLVGSWEGKDRDGKPVKVSYKLVSAGSSLMETMTMDEHEGMMVTMYHLDGDRLMMTHYCSMGNQPRMSSEAGSGDGKSITFSFVDGTNILTPDSPHMHKLVLTFKDKDHVSQEWTMRAKGKDESPVVFELTRTD
jgi:hypothetical protein